jgi:tRNA-specific 2-thiouridylase
VRKLARKYDLPVAEKDESQEICFVEDNNYGRFLKENYPDAVKPGPILDLKGNIVGQHEGIAFYTIGQRKGIGAHLGEPKYVVRIDPSMNAVIIGNNNDTLGKELFAEPVTFVSGIAPLEPIEITAKIRYNCEEAKARLIIVSREQKVDNRAHVVFDRPQRSITPGQAVVFYQGEEVLGGGIIN